MNNNGPEKLSSISKLKFLLKDSLYFGGLKAVGMLFPLITTPLLTNHLSVQNYGLYDSSLVLALFFSSFFIFGQDSAVARWFYEVDNV